MTAKQDKTAAAQGGALIYSKMVGVMRDIEAVAKSRKNQAQKYNYRGAEDLLNAIQPVLAKHGVFVVPGFESLEYKEGQSAKGAKYSEVRMVSTFEFFAEDGSSVKVHVPGQAFDYGDKAVFKAITMTLKYALATTFCVPFAKLDEGDEGDEIKPGNAPKKVGRISEGKIQEIVEKAKQEQSMKPLVELYNSMPEAQKGEMKSMFTDVRKAIEEAKK